ncbi:hypothetical protein K8R43_04395 [archaeon]|nr:hypothetical protein [archaeon]
MNCPTCGKKLAGTGKGPKSKTRPNRKFGGVLCHSCTERTIKLKTRLDEKTITKDDIEPKYQKYVQQVVINTTEKPKRQTKKKK